MKLFKLTTVTDDAQVTTINTNYNVLYGQTSRKGPRSEEHLHIMAVQRLL